MDKRFNKITARLSEYSLGKFDKRLTVSPRLDEVDAFINGINMLGDELKAITVSRNYFTNIFNAVSDMVFVLNSKGIIEDANRSAELQLNYGRGGLKGKAINDLHEGARSYFKFISTQLKSNRSLIANESLLLTKRGSVIPVKINASYFKNDHDRRRLILLTATDITYQRQTEYIVLRAIIDTQEAERQRLAKDLHDSLTQDLSAIKFYISTILGLAKSQHLKTILLKSNEALADVISEMRNICFNLMPRTLGEFGLVKAVQEFSNHFLYHRKVQFVIRQNSSLPDFSSALKIDLYRVIQEFITNAIKHGKAKKIDIFFSCNTKDLKVRLMDNGKGFNIGHHQNGMGLQNMQSRIKLHNGKLNMESEISKGTCYTIIIPLNN